MDLSNLQVATLLRQVAAAYTVKKGNLFQIRAYETAADAVEHSTSEVYDLWQEGKLDTIPGVGESLKSHLNELFKTGRVKHWQTIEKGIPKGFFEFLDVPGIGPKTAFELASLGVKDKSDLKSKIKSGLLVKKGFSEKIASKVLPSLKSLTKVKSGRMLLPFAYSQAEKILEYLRKDSNVLEADALGSLRRMVATVGDLDFSVSSNNPQAVVGHITQMPGVSQVLDRGETKATVVLSTGLRLDFLISQPDCYGALLQHFTGSKQHNIHLRSLAEKMNLSLSEYGVKNTKTGKVHPTKTEKELYTLLGMSTPEPEIREDTGEIEAALKHHLPVLIKVEDIRGDLHLHSDFPLEPSHGPGSNSIAEVVNAAVGMGYSYLGMADHPPSFTNHTSDQIIDLIKRRKDKIDQINRTSKNTRVLNLLEVDILPDGKLSVPDEGLKLLDFALAGIHSSHSQTKEQMTKRIITALGNPYVKVLTHPTSRLLNERDASQADWAEVFKVASKGKQVLEINAYPNRLDLPDVLVREALGFGVKFVINTDSHDISQMGNIQFGVAVARRGWCQKEDVVNSWEWQKFAGWFMIKR